MITSKNSIRLQSLTSGLLQAMRQAQEIEDIATANLGRSMVQSSGLTIADAQFEIACEILTPADVDAGSEKSVAPDIRIRLLDSTSSKPPEQVVSKIRNMYIRLFGSIAGKPPEQVVSKIRIRLVSNNLIVDENTNQ